MGWWVLLWTNEVRVSNKVSEVHVLRALLPFKYKV